MNHRDWLRLRKDGGNIALLLKSKKYRVVKKPRQLLWYIQPPGSQVFGLTYLTSPINDWVLIPEGVESEEKLKLKSIVDQHLIRLKRSSGR